MRASLFILVLILAASALAAPQEVAVRREEVRVYLLDVYGNCSSSHIEVVIAIEYPAGNITVVERVKGIVPDTLAVLEGPKPTSIKELEDGYVELVWSFNREEEGSLVLKYRAESQISAPLSVRAEFEGRVLDNESYVIRNVTVGDRVRIKVRLLSFSDRTLGDCAYPYPTLVVLTYPKRMLEVCETLPEPNATASQDSDGVVYWSFKLEREALLRIEFRVEDMSAWRSIWIPPLTIQLIDDPEGIVRYAERSGLRETLEEAVSSYEYLRELREGLENVSTDVEHMAGVMKSIGFKEMEASRELARVAKTLNSLLRLFEKEGINSSDIRKAVEEAVKLVDNAMEVLGLLEDLLESLPSIDGPLSDVRERALERIREARRSLASVKKTLASLKHSSPTSPISRLRELYISLSTAQRMLSESGSMHVKLAEELEGQYAERVGSVLELLDRMIVELEDRIEHLNKTCRKMECLEKEAKRRLEEWRDSVTVYVDGAERGFIGSFTVKHLVYVKLPLITSEIPQPSRPQRRAEEEGGVAWRFHVLSVLPLIAILAILKLKARRRKEEFEGVEDELLELIDEIEELLKQSSNYPNS